MSTLLYSFRRCPYAMRARMAVAYSGVPVELIEVSLKAKPPEMLERSPKGTVPVLVLDDQVLEQSLDIMRWALAQHDPDDWSMASDPEAQRQIADLIAENDTGFKTDLDHYKYAVRHPEFTQAEYRARGEVFLNKLEGLLSDRDFLVTDHLTLADIALAPFVRQFCGVDPDWFWQAPYPRLQGWLTRFLESGLFKQAMKK
ncbi:glutathione S-transferase [Pseudomonas abietaniphila]|uniref:Glutathione S-transferase n=1 Tax=Pseudomonas abietaniphila TaxID=89065 RepID=A0A1G8ND33_9PSED|nr:glutathione S-transferase [Pseudomonas abietaniphila]SDI77996.1 Glutathione S-transferase [Pseudomonas abietaniphila]